MSKLHDRLSRRTYWIALAVLNALLAPVIAFAAPKISENLRHRGELVAARRVTAKYQDVNAALADGYQPVGPCIEDPKLGRMGFHYINNQLATTKSSNRYSRSSCCTRPRRPD